MPTPREVALAAAAARARNTSAREPNKQAPDQGVNLGNRLTRAGARGRAEAERRFGKTTAQEPGEQQTPETPTGAAIGRTVKSGDRGRAEVLRRFGKTAASTD